MLCPRCQAALSDDAVICDVCSAIIDPTFLGGDITNEEAPPVAEQTRVRRIEIAEPAPPSSTAPASTTMPLRALQPAAAPRGPRIDLDKIAAPPPSVTEAADDLTNRFSKLPFSERLTTIFALIFLFSLGLPWRWSEAEEAVIGLFANGWPLGIVVLLVCIAPFARRTPELKPYRREILLSNLIAAAVAAGGTGLYFQKSWDRGLVYMAGKAPVMEWKMTPHIGLWIALIAVVLMLLGALVTYARSGQLSD